MKHLLLSLAISASMHSFAQCPNTSWGDTAYSGQAIFQTFKACLHGDWIETTTHINTYPASLPVVVKVIQQLPTFKIISEDTVQAASFVNTGVLLSSAHFLHMDLDTTLINGNEYILQFNYVGPNLITPTIADGMQWNNYTGPPIPTAIYVGGILAGVGDPGYYPEGQIHQCTHDTTGAYVSTLTTPDADIRITVIYPSDEPCLGDFNEDGVRNADDLAIFAAEYGCYSNCKADLNGDGIVGIDDYFIFSGVYGDVCP